MRKIAILTSTRAEYGLLSSVIKKLMVIQSVEVQVLVTGTHLSPEYGMTICEIENDGIEITKKIEILLSSDTAVGVSKAMGLALISFSEYFEEEKPNALLVLGDRYESLAVCIAAVNSLVPIIHLHGGEATEGLVDECIRNSITKMSYLHFASTERYRQRIIQMGEDPSRVYNVGALGVENVVNTELLGKSELDSILNVTHDKYAVLTFHPVTLQEQSAELQIEELLNAAVEYEDIVFVCTKANADKEGRIINRYLNEYSTRYANIVVFDSLGMKKYLSAVRYALFVIGNSSSGIIEAPSFHIPTINIGDRQKGRIQSDTVINCRPEKDEICNAINKALEVKFRAEIKNIKNPYEGNATSDDIVHITMDYLLNDKLEVQKTFYDLELGGVI